MINIEPHQDKLQYSIRPKLFFELCPAILGVKTQLTHIVCVRFRAILIKITFNN